MKVTLLDEQGLVLTEVSSHVGRSPGQMLVDWATRPDALFQYYFDRDGRAVTLVTDAARYSAVLGTRWQMGARFWFLRTFDRLRTASPDPRTCSAQDSGLAAVSIRSGQTKHAKAAPRAPAIARESEPPDVPA